MMRASAQKMLPMLIPALAALLRDGEDGGGDMEGRARLVAVEGTAVSDSLDAEDVAGDDEEGVVLTVFEGIVVEDTAALVLWSPPTCLIADKPHVCGSTVSSDVRLKVGVFLKSSPAKFSTCMWQSPLLLYSLYGKD